MSNKLSAYQAFQNMKSGIAAVVKATEDALKGGLVNGVTKNSLEKTKAKGFVEFVKKYNLPTVEGKVGGGSRGGVIQTAIALAKGDENHAIVKAAKAYHAQGNILTAELKNFKRSLSPGYIRSEKVVEAPKA